LVKTKGGEAPPKKDGSPPVPKGKRAAEILKLNRARRHIAAPCNTPYPTPPFGFYLYLDKNKEGKGQGDGWRPRVPISKNLKDVTMGNQQEN